MSLFDVETGIELFSLPNHEHSVRYLRWSSKTNVPSPTALFTPETSFQNRSLLLQNRNIRSDDDILDDSASSSTNSPLISSTSKQSFSVLCSVSQDRTIFSYVYICSSPSN